MSLGLCKHVVHTLQNCSILNSCVHMFLVGSNEQPEGTRNLPLFAGTICPTRDYFGHLSVQHLNPG